MCSGSSSDTPGLVKELMLLGYRSYSTLAEIVNQWKLVSDELIVKLLSKRLESGEAKSESGFILDGYFPRTINQVEILNEVSDINLVLNLKLREDVIVAKCLGRRICSECGKKLRCCSHLCKGREWKPWYVHGSVAPSCSLCNKVVTRANDTVEVAKKRLQTYNEMSQPVEEFHCSRCKLMDFDLLGRIPESWPKLLHVLNLEQS
ncbi:unnamed protein product [Rhodiola kirilowii]